MFCLAKFGLDHGNLDYSMVMLEIVDHRYPPKHTLPEQAKLMFRSRKMVDNNILDVY